MADLKAFKELIKITSLNGMNSNSPQGMVKGDSLWRPYRLENADFGRTGGWQTQTKASLQIAGTTFALSALYGADLFYSLAGVLNYYDSTTRASTPIPSATNLSTLAPIMPGLLASYSLTTQPPLTSAGGSQRPTNTFLNQYVLKSGTYSAGGTGGLGAITVTYTAQGTGETGFANTASYEFYVVFNSPDSRVSGHFPQAQAVYFVSPTTTPPNPHVPEINFTTGVGTIGGVVYWRPNSSSQPWKVGLVSPPGQPFVNGRVQMVDLGVPEGTIDYFTYKTDPSMPREFHQGRVFIVPDRYQYFDSSANSSGIQEDGSPIRLLYSEVIATASNKSLPTFSVQNFIDIPFVVSKKIVALKSTGRYLYVFGDRELFVLTGNSDKDFQLESLGDSLGSVSTGSVQRLGASVFWLSDSGVMKVSGGTVAEAGEDVRPNLLALNMALVSSTVDFVNEVYYLTDGAQTLTYWVREDAWTLRVDGVSTSLLYGGGTPLSIGTGGLYALGGTNDLNNAFPGWLQLKAYFSAHEFDSWHTRKEFRQVLLGYENTQGAATLTLDYDTGEGGTAGTRTHPITAASTAHKAIFGLGTVSGYQFGFTLTGTPSTYAPLLLRPPLSVMGDPKGEQG